MTWSPKTVGGCPADGGAHALGGRVGAGSAAARPGEGSASPGPLAAAFVPPSGAAPWARALLPPTAPAVTTGLRVESIRRVLEPGNGGRPQWLAIPAPPSSSRPPSRPPSPQAPLGPYDAVVFSVPAPQLLPGGALCVGGEDWSAVLRETGVGERLSAVRYGGCLTAVGWGTKADVDAAFAALAARKGAKRPRAGHVVFGKEEEVKGEGTGILYSASNEPVRRGGAGGVAGAASAPEASAAADGPFSSALVLHTTSAFTSRHFGANGVDAGRREVLALLEAEAPAAFALLSRPFRTPAAAATTAAAAAATPAPEPTTKWHRWKYAQVERHMDAGGGSGGGGASAPALRLDAPSFPPVFLCGDYFRAGSGSGSSSGSAGPVRPTEEGGEGVENALLSGAAAADLVADWAERGGRGE
jgi:hypothetical protein